MNRAGSSTERRTQRSPWASEALCLQLRQVAHRHDLELLVLADDAGNLWASSGFDAQAEDLAGQLPQLDLALSPDGLHRAEHRDRGLRVKELQVDATRLLLAAQGRGSARGLREAAPGVTRILSALAADAGA